MNDPLTLAINLPASVRRRLAVLLLSAKVLVATACVVTVANLLAARQDEIDELRRELGRVQVLAERGRDLREEAEEQGRSVDALFLAGADEAAAASALQTVVTAVARESGLDVISSGRAPSFAAQGLVTIGVRIDVGGSMPAIYNYLDTLYHRLPNVDIRKVGVWRATGGSAPDQDQVEVVGQIEVFGALPPDASGEDGTR